ncbi:NUDIX domain-containing protein [Tsukamurella sp. 8F]|uniref:NUDIX hydrolase n=1 Tax=unclassified Tsukamurella TaxID=2633480 RepID=UPI0023B9E88F|nr:MULTISPECIES: NUDIX domain-containing protein [unclassified Tsukamurella]MDF0529761.1 NUDIX domain-containing protein [Tsukamurella sp. 8J]MDF0586046.1 NUDIX domain-containing protein [Tsukamurella sp. 8F]
MSVSITPAATVVLLRTGTDGVEVFLLRRSSGMVFAGGMTVFPGGGLDAADGDDLTVTAARETFEECGVLLVDGLVRDGGHVAERAAVESHELTFADFLRSEGLRLDTDRLVPFARWITPPGRTRRYDTHFYLAALPVGQSADLRTTEAVAAGWVRPEIALAQYEAATHTLMTPTYSVLHTLCGFDTAEDALGWAAEVVIEPVGVDEGRSEDERRFPGRDEYIAARARHDLARKALEAGREAIEAAQEP